MGNVKTIIVFRFAVHKNGHRNQKDEAELNQGECDVVDEVFAE